MYRIQINKLDEWKKFLEVNLEEVLQLVQERVVAVVQAQVGHVGARDVVAGHALLRVVGAQPVLLHLKIVRAIQLITI